MHLNFNKNLQYCNWNTKVKNMLPLEKEWKIVLKQSYSFRVLFARKTALIQCHRHTPKLNSLEPAPICTFLSGRGGRFFKLQPIKNSFLASVVCLSKINEQLSKQIPIPVQTLSRSIWVSIFQFLPRRKILHTYIHKRMLWDKNYGCFPCGGGCRYCTTTDKSVHSTLCGWNNEEF